MKSTLEKSRVFFIYEEVKSTEIAGEGVTYYESFCEGLNKSFKTVGINTTAEEFWGTPYLYLASGGSSISLDISTGVCGSGTIAATTKLVHNSAIRMVYSDPISREEACYIMYDACTNVLGEDLKATKGIQNIINAPDGIVYQNEVYKCVSNGLIAGIDDNYTIAPYQALTRAQACCIIARITDTSRRLEKPVVPKNNNGNR